MFHIILYCCYITIFDIAIRTYGLDRSDQFTDNPTPGSCQLWFGAGADPDQPRAECSVLSVGSVKARWSAWPEYQSTVNHQLCSLSVLR